MRDSGVGGNFVTTVGAGGGTGHEWNGANFLGPASALPSLKGPKV